MNSFKCSMCFQKIKVRQTVDLYDVHINRVTVDYGASHIWDKPACKRPEGKFCQSPPPVLPPHPTRPLPKSPRLLSPAKDQATSMCDNHRWVLPHWCEVNTNMLQYTVKVYYWGSQQDFVSQDQICFQRQSSYLLGQGGTYRIYFHFVQGLGNRPDCYRYSWGLPSHGLCLHIFDTISLSLYKVMVDYFSSAPFQSPY